MEARGLIHLEMCTVRTVQMYSLYSTGVQYVQYRMQSTEERVVI